MDIARTALRARASVAAADAATPAASALQLLKPIPRLPPTCGVSGFWVPKWAVLALTSKADVGDGRSGFVSSRSSRRYHITPPTNRTPAPLQPEIRRGVVGVTSRACKRLPLTSEPRGGNGFHKALAVRLRAALALARRLAVAGHRVDDVDHLEESAVRGDAV